MATIADIRVIPIPAAERVGIMRDTWARPATPMDNAADIDVWHAEPIAEFVAYRCERHPAVTILYFPRHQTFAAKWSHDGMSASVDVSTLDAVLAAAYGYAAWPLTIKTGVA